LGLFDTIGKTELPFQHLADITCARCIIQQNLFTPAQSLPQADFDLQFGLYPFGFLDVAAYAYFDLFRMDLLVLCDRRDGEHDSTAQRGR
jgi:hypothetical protein